MPFINVALLLDVISQVGTRTIFVTIIVAILFSYYIKKRFFEFQKISSFSRKWKSPFVEDTRKPLTLLETDKVKRNEVLKKTFTKQLATEKEWDAIVIGSGIGGMSTAALLSKAGMKVLVLEKHYKCGGACHTFKEKGYEFDVGIQYTGNFIRPTLARTYLEQISDGEIQWDHFNGDFDNLIIDDTLSKRQFNIPTGVGVFENQLMKQFPDEIKAIETYFAMIKRAHSPLSLASFLAIKLLPFWLINVVSQMGLWCRLSDFFALGRRSVKEIVESLTNNKELRFLLSYISTTFVLPPSRVSFAWNATVHIHHLENGFCFPKGGGSEIPYRIAPVIERSGGRVLTKANVIQILTIGKKVTGVRVRTNVDVVDILAPVVISDAGILNTLLHLVPQDVAKSSLAWPLTSLIKSSIGCLSVSIGFKGTPKELGLPTQNILIFNDGDLEKVYCDTCNIKTAEELIDKPFPVSFVSSGSAKDSSWEQRYPGRSALTILVFVPYSLFSQWSERSVKKRGETYNNIKKELGKKTTEQLVQLYPRLKNAVDHVSVGTPITMQHFLNAKEGAIFGLEHDVKRFSPQQASLLRPESGIEGLFFTGQDVMSSGIYSTLISGFLCASAVLKKRVSLALDLYVLHKKIHGQSQHLTDLHF